MKRNNYYDVTDWQVGNPLTVSLQTSRTDRRIQM